MKLERENLWGPDVIEFVFSDWLVPKDRNRCFVQLRFLPEQLRLLSTCDFITFSLSQPL